MNTGSRTITCLEDGTWGWEEQPSCQEIGIYNIIVPLRATAHNLLRPGSVLQVVFQGHSPKLMAQPDLRES